MKHGNVVDPETAQKIVKAIASRIQMMSGRELHLRPVIWPEKIIHEIFDNDKEPEPGLPQRELVHLMCLANEIRILVHIPNYDEGSKNLFGVVVLEYRANYYGQMLFERTPKVYVGDKDMKHKLDEAYAIFESRFGRDPGAHEVIAIEEVLKEIDTSEDIAEAEKKALPLCRASALEHFAFSTYATTRPRPTTKQAVNPNPRKKGWPAIEVVNLRLPEKRAHSAPTGRKINIRYDVIEHLRRQPTKEGIKLITVRAHERGPEGAPKKPKTINKVYKVVK